VDLSKNEKTKKRRRKTVVKVSQALRGYRETGSQFSTNFFAGFRNQVDLLPVLFCSRVKKIQERKSRCPDFLSTLQIIGCFKSVNSRLGSTEGIYLSLALTESIRRTSK
jgi:hypothetical protein